MLRLQTVQDQDRALHENINQKDLYERTSFSADRSLEVTELTIEHVGIDDSEAGAFINQAFTDYAVKKDVALNFDEYCYVAVNEAGKIVGAVTGRAYYNEVHIGDLVVDEADRGHRVGTELVRTVEKAYRNRGYRKITLTTFGFQAPEFYKKLGYSLEFVREDEDPKLRKYFYCKSL